jgi:integrase
LIIKRHETHIPRHLGKLNMRTRSGHVNDSPLKLSEETIRRLPRPAKGNSITYFAGATIQGAKAPRGFGVRVTASGARAFIINYRQRGREYRYTIGGWPDWSALKAVREARNLRQRIDRGENPLDDRAPISTSKSVSDVIDNFMTRYVRNKERPLRSAAQIQSAFDRLVKPRIGKLGICELRRSHVAQLLDHIENVAGPVQADRVRAYLSKALSWYAERDDDFNLNAAFVKVRARANAKERARARVLSDEEIRTIWPLLEGTFGALLKILLLTAQRRDEVSRMTWKEISEDGIWTIPAERYKTKRPNHVPLSKTASGIIANHGRTDNCDFVFPSRKGTAFSSFGKSKARLDKLTLSVMQKATAQGRKFEAAPNWRIHDLRRTAKTLMARAGVRPDISERVLGHVIGGWRALTIAICISMKSEMLWRSLQPSYKESSAMEPKVHSQCSTRAIMMKQPASSQSTFCPIELKWRQLPPSPPAGFVEFWRKRRPLIKQLRVARTATTPFDTDLALRELADFAWRFLEFEASPITSCMKRSDRAKRLSMFARHIEQTLQLADQAFEDELRWDLFRAWCVHFDVRPGLDLLKNADDLRGSFERLRLLRDIVREAERRVRPPPGRPIGPSVHPHWDVLVGLARLFRRTTGMKPTASNGKFAKFAYECLRALGRNQMKYETLLAGIKMARRNANRYSPIWGFSSPFT